MELLKHTTRIVNRNLKVKIEIKLEFQKDTGLRYFNISATSRKRGNLFKRVFFFKKFISTSYPIHKISEAFPELKPIVNLHLSDTLGRPPFVIGKGFEMVKKNNKKEVMAYFRITEDEYYILYSSNSRVTFFKILAEFDIIKRWKSEADKALEIMDKLCYPICGVNFDEQNPFIGEESQLLKVESSSELR